jgi:AcrR family transcriptional regulator
VPGKSSNGVARGDAAPDDSGGGTAERPVRKRRGSKSSITAVAPTLRRPGVELGPRANRTIASILDATRQLLLMRGYAGATVDEITRIAGVSRASFYTYFPSKRDVLLALGTNSAHAALALIDALGAVPPDWTLDDLQDWVRYYFAFLDEQGSFVFAWTQAAHEDEEIRVAGMRGHLSLCRRMGQKLAWLGDIEVDDPAELGLTVFSMIERSWAYCQLYAGTIEAAVVQRRIATMIEATVRPSLRPSPAGR